MAIEWVAISAAAGAYLRKYAGERAEKLGTRYADGVFAETYRRLVPEAKLVQANEAFVTRFSKELDSEMDLPTLLAERYQEALKQFLSNSSVQDALLAPLDGESQLNWEVRRGTWAELRLIELPGDFDWAKVARTYRESIKRLMLADPDLRPVIEAIASLRSAAALERLAGPARAFDLTRYAGALKAAHGHLKLGPLDPDWTQYEGRVRLESVYVPQSVKQALPPRDLTRDYLRSLKEERRAHGIERDEEEVQRRKEEYAQLGTRPLMEIVDDAGHERLVLLGDPGLGKSTLLKHLALRWAEEPGRPVTLLIELRRASRESGHASFLDYLERGAGQTCCLPKVELDEHLRNNASLVLFDGPRSRSWREAGRMIPAPSPCRRTALHEMTTRKSGRRRCGSWRGAGRRIPRSKSSSPISASFRRPEPQFQEIEKLGVRRRSSGPETGARDSRWKRQQLLDTRRPFQIIARVSD